MVNPNPKIFLGRNFFYDAWSRTFILFTLDLTSYTVRIILTNFIKYVKILCNLHHFYNDLDRRCKISWMSHSHMKKLWPARGSNWWPLDLKSDTLPLSYSALHARGNIIVDFELGESLKLDNFHNFMNSAIQSSVVHAGVTHLPPNPRVVGLNHCDANFFKCEHYYNVCQDRCKNGSDYTRSWQTL